MGVSWLITHVADKERRYKNKVMIRETPTKRLCEIQQNKYKVMINDSGNELYQSLCGIWRIMMEMLCAGTIASIMTSSCLCMKKVILEVMSVWSASSSVFMHDNTWEWWWGKKGVGGGRHESTKLLLYLFGASVFQREFAAFDKDQTQDYWPGNLYRDK